MKRVDIRDQRRILDDFFKVDEAHLSYERFDGSMSPTVRRLTFERGDSVAAVVYDTAARRLLFTNQFKYPTYEKGPGWITEIIAGSIEHGESPESAIRREIREELGYRVSAVEHVSTFYVTPGGSSERIVLYYVEVSEPAREGRGGGVASEGEDILTIALTLEEAQKQIATGEIMDAKTIIGILWLSSRVSR